MENQPDLVLPVELSKKYKEAMRVNLAAQMRANHMNQPQLIEALAQRGLSVEQGNLSQYLSGRKSIPLGLIVHLCDLFQISLAELVGEDFGKGCSVSGSDSCAQVLYSDDLLLQLPSLGTSFVTDPYRPEFQGYLQSYYIYYKPTQPEDGTLLTGTLVLEANGSVCDATLTIHANKTAGGQPVRKIYNGRAVISTAVDAVYILLASPVEGELSVISFRHLHLPHQPLDCRIAATLTNSAGEYHSPTIHRMFLSRTEIKPEHLPLLLPHLDLNTNKLCIKKEQLDQLSERSPEYAAVIDRLTYGSEPEPTYFWGEDYLLGTAKLSMSKPQHLTFLSHVRDQSVSEHLNKSSRRADLLVRELLMSLGYYRDHDI